MKIKKDKRNLGYYFHKGTGFNSTKSKKFAMKDITNEYDINYVYKESLVLKYCKHAKKTKLINI